MTFNSSFSGNAAPNGGGGGLLWHGSVSPVGIGCPKGMKFVEVLCEMPSRSFDCSWATCVPCDSGTYKSEAGDLACKACTAGTYVGLSGSTSCIGCNAGYFANVDGAESSAVCMSCRTGSFSLPGASECTLCPMGTYSFQNASSECSICSPGKFLPLVGANTSSLCEPCGYGQYSSDAASTCLDCMFGTFSDRIASTSCRLCSSGRYTSFMGASSNESCASCELGKYVHSGRSQCSLCISSVYSQADTVPVYQERSDIVTCVISALSGSIGRFVPNGKYANNERIYWLIRQSSLSYFTLEFTDFEIERDYDFVSMYSCADEDCVGDMMDARFFSNKLYPGPQEFYAVAVLIVWMSDGAFSYKGWRADFRVSKEAFASSRLSHDLDFEGSKRFLANSTKISPDNDQVQGQALHETTLKLRKFTRIFAEERFSVMSSTQPDINRRHKNSQAWMSTARHSIVAVDSNVHDSAHPDTHLQHVLENLFKFSQHLRAIPPKKISGFCCDDTNTALYGKCIASDYKRLLYVLPSSSTFWPGLTFEVTALKVDAYNQIILSDSMSHVDLLIYSGASHLLQQNSFVLVGSTTAKLEKGTGKILVSIRPRLNLTLPTSDSFQFSVLLILQGIDADLHGSSGLMQSNHFSMSIRNRSQVCPSGYVLLGAEETATCSICSAGKYSLDPTAPAPDSISRQPECLNCPEGGICGGGASVSFFVGRWEIEASAYILKSCPNGYQLVNSTNGNSRGMFSHDRQHCKQCLPGQYIIDPNIHECKMCPQGANCTDPSKPTFLVPQSEWISDGGVWVLVGCPPRFFLDTGPQCTLCPAGFYCIGRSYPPTPCGASQFSLSGASAQSSCKKAVFVIIVVDIPLLVFNFGEAIANKLHLVFSRLINKSREHIILKSAEQSNNGESTIVTSSIAADNEVDADDIARKMDRQAVQVALESQGFSGSDFVSLQMTACMPGFELSNSRTCQPCPERYFCVGGTNVRESCSSGFFSTARANSSKSCFQAVFVRISFSVPVSKENFTERFKAIFQTLVSKVAHVPIERVVLSSFKIQSRRTEFSGTVEVEIATDNAESAAAVSSRLSPPDELNFQMIAQGLPTVSLNSISVTESVQSANNSISQWIAVGVILGSLVIMVPILVRVLKPKGSAEERTLQRAISELLLRLEVTRKNGFLLNSESVPFWQSSKHFISIQKCHAEAAARLSMLLDFDVNQFDAFCLCLEGDFGGYLIDQEISKKNLMGNKTRQYCLLCDWLLEIGTNLIRPEGISDPSELNVGPVLRVEMRFRFLMQKVLKARLWQDSECALFRRLQAGNSQDSRSFNLCSI
jgi:hypothetical protein